HVRAPRHRTYARSRFLRAAKRSHGRAMRRRRHRARVAIERIGAWDRVRGRVHTPDLERTPAMSDKASIVFAHGLWADGSCYSKVIPTLQAEGHEVVSAQNSLDSLEGDVAAVRRALGRIRSPAVLVGHSQGGTIITHAGADDRVAAL